MNAVIKVEYHKLNGTFFVQYEGPKPMCEAASKINYGLLEQ